MLMDTKTICHRLIERYYPNNAIILEGLELLSPSQFLRLFITVSGMKPTGQWLTHTYCKLYDDLTNKYHFFLIPMKSETSENSVNIRIEHDRLKIDEFETNIELQNIPHTTPFWYFHYNPNMENKPYHSMTLNLSPSCFEKCVLCAGAKTGRVNNGMKDILDPDMIYANIFNQHPEAKTQLDSIAIVTGCFDNFNLLESHLKNVKDSVYPYVKPAQFRVLEHNISSHSQFNSIVGELGYEVFITLECFDQAIRNIALNGKVGRKGRDSEEYIEMINVYANYLENQINRNHSLVRVTYLAGLDSLDVTEKFFERIARMNQTLLHVNIIPWISIFTVYNKAMKTLQRSDFGLAYLLKVMKLANQYFGNEMMANESGSTSDGYARGLY